MTYKGICITIIVESTCRSAAGLINVMYRRSTMDNSLKTMDKIVALCKGRGFIFPGSDIYGGLANTWDYGPLGARMKNNVKDTWRKRFIQERRNSYEVDADILMHPRVW